MHREHPDFPRSTCTHWHHRCIIRTHHSCAPPATSYHTQYAPEPDRPFARGRCSLNIDYYKIPFWNISRNPTFSVPSKPQSPTLLGSNLGTNPYVLRSLWDLLLSNSNSRLFSPGHTLSPRFLSLGNTRRVPDTRPSETTSRSNSPVYPRRGHTPSRRGLFNTNTHTHPMTYLLLLPPYDLLHLPPYNNVAPSTLKQCFANCYSTL